MLIRHVEYFVTLAEEGHFGRAAALCGITQPALSATLRKLEDELAVPLILRGQRYQGLTAEGEKLLAWGRQILSNYDSLREDLDGRRRGGLNVTLRLGAVAAAMPLLVGFSELFERRNPMSRIAVRLLDDAQIAAGLADFSIDGAFGQMPEDDNAPDHLARYPMWSSRPLFACRDDHPFASEETIGLEDAATQPLCTLTGYQMPPQIRRVNIVLDTLGAVIPHLTSGGWCAILPDTVRPALPTGSGLCLIPFADAPPARQIGAICLGQRPQSPAAQAFEQSVQAYLAARAR